MSAGQESGKRDEWANGSRRLSEREAVKVVRVEVALQMTKRALRRELLKNELRMTFA